VVHGRSERKTHADYFAECIPDNRFAEPDSIFGVGIICHAAFEAGLGYESGGCSCSDQFDNCTRDSLDLENRCRVT